MGWLPAFDRCAAIELGERLRDLHPPRRPGGVEPLPPARPRPIPDACASNPPPTREGRCFATTRSRDRRMRATTGSRSSANTTASASGYLHTQLAVDDQLDVAAPRGAFVLDRSDVPVLLISAGIGATPVLAMFARTRGRATRTARSGGSMAARCGRDHSFASEAHALLAYLPNVRRSHLLQPPRHPTIGEGRDYDRTSRLTASEVADLDPPPSAEAYLCGPRRFMDEISAGLAGLGLDPSRIHTEPFGPAPGGDARHRLDTGTHAPSARRPTRNRSNDRVRPQQPRHPVEQRLRESPRTRRSLRRSRPVVLANKHLPQLRDAPNRRRDLDYNPEPVEPPADGSAFICFARNRAATWCSTCE